tara:strand:+ start:639 stop:890 length:252 start_codon:yes stop_codon:yes gene_type:complete
MNNVPSPIFHNKYKHSFPKEEEERERKGKNQSRGSRFQHDNGTTPQLDLTTSLDKEQNSHRQLYRSRKNGIKKTQVRIRKHQK